MLTRNIWEHQNGEFSSDRMFYASTTDKWPPTYTFAKNNRNNMQNNLFVKVICVWQWIYMNNHEQVQQVKTYLTI